MLGLKGDNPEDDSTPSAIFQTGKKCELKHDTTKLTFCLQSMTRRVRRLSSFMKLENGYDCEFNGENMTKMSFYYCSEMNF